MNSNMRFDQMYKRAKLQDAKESLKCWEAGLATPGITEQEREFLNRAVVGAKANIVKWERYIEEWWT